MSKRDTMSNSKIITENAAVSPMGYSMDTVADDFVRRALEIAKQLAADRKSGKPLGEPLMNAHSDMRALVSDFGMAIEEVAPDAKSSRRSQRVFLGARQRPQRVTGHTPA